MNSVDISWIWDYLFIFFARVTDVSIGTLRLMLMVRGRRWLASVLSFFEVGVWLLALTRVLSNLDNPWKMLVYCLGFATGVYVGQWIEELLALGVSSAQVIPRSAEAAQALRDALRQEGFGVTTLMGEGRQGPRMVLLVTSPRRGIPRLLEIIRRYDDHAFVTVIDTRASLGGHMQLGRR